MKDQSFTISIEIPAAPAEVFGHIINDVSKWWTEDFKGSSAKLDDEFVIHHPGAHYSKQRVTEFIPGKKVVWLVTESDLTWLENKEEWTGTKMIFELTPNGVNTALNFTHEGLVPGLECYDRVSEGWSVVVGSRLLNFIAGQQAKSKNKAAKYTVAIEIAKSPEVVFGHIVNNIPKYWPEEFEGQCSKMNDEFIFRSGGDAHYSKHLVTEFLPGKRVVWLVTESLRKPDNFDWTGTKMIFELTAKGDNTLLTFTYDGFTLENEYGRLVQVCDFVIKDSLYNFINSN